MPVDPASLSSAQQRSLLLEYRFNVHGRGLREICAAYDMPLAAFQRLRKAREAQFAAEEEMVIAGVHERAHTIEDLASYLDYRNHAGYRPEEVRAFLDNLESIGVLTKQDDQWRFTPGSPAATGRFIFTAPKGAPHQPVYFGEQRHPHWKSGA